MNNNLLGEGVAYKVTAVNKRKVSYFESGSKDDATILLIHGFGSTALNFLPLMRELNHYHLIAVDLPARRESSFSFDEDFYQPKNLAHWLHDFVEHIGLSNFHIAAHSMGAHYMFEYALCYPVLSCISLDGGYIVPSLFPNYSLEEELNNTKAYIENLLFENEDEYYNKMKEQGESEETALIDRRLLVEKDGKLYFNMPAEVAVNYVKGASNYPDYELLENIKVPVLLLRSDLPAEYNEVREKSIEQFLKHLSAELIVVKDSKHSIYTSQKEQTAKYINNWMRKNISSKTFGKEVR
ncbi:alpha/beta fold hydrolase [Macrococcus lamae]|uniref:Alpha/beta hydrolase n=1 Tax=Macrococcus lamae TaxID=198484 RepID=A0A4R6BUW4_9STAP|nr:alpha/beta hydrolase [Macrococcus lamae]TDM12133.1 alpha/beta hydrolase [Macrococcus lamae]